MNYNIFLSYQSEDGDLADRLKDDLQRRGVRVWLVEDCIKRGDEFPDALKDGIQTSDILGLLVTPESLRSKSVQREIRRATDGSEMEEEDNPASLQGCKAAERSRIRQRIDFRADSDFMRGVTKLVWPGITGKDVVFMGVHPGHISPWEALEEAVRKLGLKFIPGEDIDRRGAGCANISAGAESSQSLIRSRTGRQLGGGGIPPSSMQNGF